MHESLANVIRLVSQPISGISSSSDGTKTHFVESQSARALFCMWLLPGELMQLRRKSSTFFTMEHLLKRGSSGELFPGIQTQQLMTAPTS